MSGEVSRFAFFLGDALVLLKFLSKGISLDRRLSALLKLLFENCWKNEGVRKNCSVY